MPKLANILLSWQRGSKTNRNHKMFKNRLQMSKYIFMSMLMMFNSNQNILKMRKSSILKAKGKSVLWSGAKLEQRKMC